MGRKKANEVKSEALLRQEFGDAVVDRAHRVAQKLTKEEQLRRDDIQHRALLPSIKPTLTPIVKFEHDAESRSRNIEEIAVRLERNETSRAADISAQKKRKRHAKHQAAVEKSVLDAVATGNRPNVNNVEHFGVRQMESPLDPTRRVPIATSLRDDPLGRLHKRKQIDEAQMQAGRKWQEDWEQAEIGGARAIDPSREHVDGGRVAEPWNERQISATARLSRCARWLGQEGEKLVRDVLGDRMSLAQCAVMRGLNPHSHNDMVYLGRRLRECLETLAFRLGCAIKGPSEGAPEDSAAILGEVRSNPRLYDAVQRALREA